MSSFGTIPLKDIWRMLDACAPGHVKKEREHNWLVRHRGRSYPSLPRGPHGRRTNPDIEIGHVRKRARMLDIENCAKAQLPQL